jgi:hypothetical protein
VDAVIESESPLPVGTPPSSKSIDALLLTFTVPGFGAPGRVTAAPTLFSRS